MGHNRANNFINFLLVVLAYDATFDHQGQAAFIMLLLCSCCYYYYDDDYY